MESRLLRLRALMSEGQALSTSFPSLSAYVVPSEDAHQSEYTAAPHKRRQFISGFTGSAGTAVVTTDKAMLWTDGRYFLQAEKELDSKHWQLMKQSTGDTPTIEKWLADNCLALGKTEEALVGVDPTLISHETWKKWSGVLKRGRQKVRLVGVNQNLIDVVWDEQDGGNGEGTRINEENKLKKNPIFVHPVKYAGECWQDKVGRIQEEMRKENSHLLVISELDEIAWLFNIRGSDIKYNPLFFAYAIITSRERDSHPLLFIESSKLGEAFDVLRQKVLEVLHARHVV